MRRLRRSLFSRRGADVLASTLAIAGTIAVLVNALLLQEVKPLRLTDPTGLDRAPPRAVAAAPAPNATPLPSPRPRADVPTGSGAVRFDLVREIQRELAIRGFYSGPLDGLRGPRTERAIRSFEEAEGRVATGEPTDALLARILRSRLNREVTGSAAPPDASAQAAQPSTRVLAVQRVLARLGYGPLSLNGLIDAPTRASIGRFQRDRGLPETAEISERLLAELAAVTGSPVR